MRLKIMAPPGYAGWEAVEPEDEPTPYRQAHLRLFLGMAAAVLTALAICMITWPLMDVATRRDNVRFG